MTRLKKDIDTLTVSLEQVKLKNKTEEEKMRGEFNKAHGNY